MQTYPARFLSVFIVLLCSTFVNLNDNLFALDSNGNSKKQSDIDISQKTRLSERELKNKKEGSYVTGLAGPGSSPDVGFGGTGIVMWYYNGEKDDPLFPYTPYLHNVSFLASYMSKGFAQFAVRWDAPYFLRSSFRVFAEAWYTMNPVSQYYGTGSSTHSTLKDPDGNTYDRMEDYDSALRTISGGTTNSHYNFYDQRDTMFRVNIQRDFSGGSIRLLGGFIFKFFEISDYSNKTVAVNKSDGTSTDAKMNTTRLNKDYLAGKILGFNGGWNNSITFGFAYDKRDLESFPRKGAFHDVVINHTSKFLGAEYEWTEITSAARFYFSPWQSADIVFATRLAYTIRTGDVPFYGMTTVQFSDRFHTSMGGMRGYRDRRFMGPVVALANAEVRYTFATWRPGTQIIEFSLAPFIDAGRVFDDVQQTHLTNWAYSYGIGLRGTWNQATVIAFDFGFSAEDFGFYLQVGHTY